MTIFWINLSVVYFLSFFARYFAAPLNIGSAFIRPNRLLVVFVITMLVLVSGLRNNIGDTFFYMHSYATNKLDWNEIEFSGDFGFNLFQAFLQRINGDPQILIFIVALITNTLIVLVLYKYSRMLELSLFVYITSNMYLTSMNGIRQYLAAAIIFAATKFILNGDWKKYILIVLFASTIHKTTLVLIPVYFMVRRKAWTMETFVLIVLAIVIVIGFNQFMGLLFSAIGDTQYGHYANFSEGGANIIRVAVFSAPLIIAYLGREKLRNLSPNIDYIVNMSLLGCIFMIISTQNWIFARFSIYFGLYELILISWIIKVFSDKEQRFIYYAILVCYFIFYYYECVISFNGVGYESDYINF